MKLLLDRIIVKRLPKEEGVTTGGIALLGKVADTLERGVILEVGPGRKTQDGVLIKTCLQIGAKVIFEKPPQPPAILNGEEVFIMYEPEIIGTL